MLEPITILAAVNDDYAHEAIDDILDKGFTAIGSFWQNSASSDCVQWEQIEDADELGLETARLRVYHPEQWEDIYFIKYPSKG